MRYNFFLCFSIHTCFVFRSNAFECVMMALTYVYIQKRCSSMRFYTFSGISKLCITILTHAFMCVTMAFLQSHVILSKVLYAFVYVSIRFDALVHVFTLQNHTWSFSSQILSVFNLSLCPRSLSICLSWVQKWKYTK